MTKIEGLKFAIKTMILIGNEKTKAGQYEGAGVAHEAQKALENLLEDIETPAKKLYTYYVDDKKYETELKLVTGLFIESELMYNRGLLFENRFNKEPDIQIHSETEVALDGEVKHFYTIYPAGFGG